MQYSSYAFETCITWILLGVRQVSRFSREILRGPFYGRKSRFDRGNVKILATRFLLPSVTLARFFCWTDVGRTLAFSQFWCDNAGEGKFFSFSEGDPPWPFTRLKQDLLLWDPRRDCFFSFWRILTGYWWQRKLFCFLNPGESLLPSLSFSGNLGRTTMIPVEKAFICRELMRFALTGWLLIFYENVCGARYIFFPVTSPTSRKLCIMHAIFRCMFTVVFQYHYRQITARFSAGRR